MDGVIQILRPQRKTADDLAPVDLLGLTADLAQTVQVDDPVRQHLGMNAQAADRGMGQQRTDRIRHPANPDLQAIAILQFRRDQPGHGAVDIAGRALGQFGHRRPIARNDEIDIADVHPGARPHHMGHGGAFLDNDHAGAFDNRAVPQVRRAKVEIALRVHRGAFDDQNIHWVDEAAIVIGDLAQIDRQVMPDPGIVQLAVMAAEMGGKPEEPRPVRV